MLDVTAHEQVEECFDKVYVPSLITQNWLQNMPKAWFHYMTVLSRVLPRTCRAVITRNLTKDNLLLSNWCILAVSSLKIRLWPYPRVEIVSLITSMSGSYFSDKS